MKKKYVVKLDQQEKANLEDLTSKGQNPARKIRRANILLLTDEGRTDKEIAKALNAATTTVERIRKRFVKEGLQAALSERPRPGAQRKLNGSQEAHLVALVCSDPPPRGKKQWTMQLLADKLVESEVVDSISDETVRRTLKRGL